MPGYSGTPLVKKLGFKAPMTIVVLGRPEEYFDWLGQLENGVEFVSRTPKRPHVVHLFVKQRSELEKRLIALRQRLRPDGFVWVSWPKKTAHVATSITEDVIRAVALPLGYVDIKVCAVSEIWSGLKLMIRKSERGKA
jgi:hypothetical protein